MTHFGRITTSSDARVDVKRNRRHLVVDSGNHDTVTDMIGFVLCTESASVLYGPRHGHSFGHSSALLLRVRHSKCRTLATQVVI